LEHALGTLRGNDRFNVFQFNSATSSLYRTPVQLTADTHAAALAWVRRLAATGGTEMEPAIRAALAQPVTPGYVRQVIFITDGAVAHETRLFSAIKQGLRDARLFTIGIGAAPNLHFMRKAAQFGRGTYTQIGDAAAVESVMRQLFDKLEHVALADVLVDWPDALEVYPQPLPDLYAGEPVVVAASFAARVDQTLAANVFGRMPAAAWSQRVVASADSLPGIATLWARRKIESLLDSRVDGVDEALIEKLVTDVALEHGLVSPYTSLVAVDKTPARSADAALERQAVGNLRPAGAVWSALPQTASAAPLYRWLGLALLVIATAGLGLGRRGGRRQLAQR
jgi:Ca-activated chloride channel family protein